MHTNNPNNYYYWKYCFESVELNLSTINFADMEGCGMDVIKYIINNGKFIIIAWYKEH